MILDVVSRYAVGWIVQHRESAELAKALIAQACEQQQIARDQLTVHADRGPSMTSKPVAFLLADLGVLKTHNRPYTSTGNPYSEAQFNTLKYRPGFPTRFDSIEHARAFCREFFGWYNEQHRHSGIGRHPARLRLWAAHLECDIDQVAGDPSTVIDELWGPIAAEQRERRNRGEPLTHGLVELEATSRRSERLLGPLQALLVDG